MFKTVCLLAALAATPIPAMAARDTTVVLTLNDHRFNPAAIDVPAGCRIHVHLINQDGAAEEFDSGDLGVEEDVTPHGATDFTLGPLKPGVYTFMGETHPATAQGRLTAR